MALDTSDSFAPSPSPALKAARKGPDFAHEEAIHAGGYLVIAGIDEAGRGPLAGPVVAAAVILDPVAIPQGLDDSKALGARQRERLFEDIIGTATVCAASVSAREIDRINIRQATLLAMRRAVTGLSQAPTHALIDGCDVPAGLACAATAVVGGDARCLSIAAASIVAKVMRDRMMTRLSGAHPLYGFERHMGYGTREHLAAIAAHGPCPLHRLSFSPLRQRLLDLTPAR